MCLCSGVLGHPDGFQEGEFVRQAWTVSGGDAKCIFHALLRFEGDDMAEHSDYEAVYSRMRELGQPEAF